LWACATSAQHSKDFRVECRPGYAPELKPEEQCNTCVTLALLNATPRSDAELRTLARRHFHRRSHKPHLLNHSFAHAGLTVT
jgi:hypothetical protein